MPSARTFIAIELLPEVLDAIKKVQAHLRHGEGGRAGRWVRVESIHLTLKFLGDVLEEDLDNVYQATQRACQGQKPFALAVAGLGCFPNARRPRVIWVGVHEQTGQLVALQQSIEHELGQMGFPKEKRAFRAHLTLARIQRRAPRQEIEALGRSVARYQVGELAQMHATEVSVMKSDLRPTGAIYTELFRASLGD